MNIIDLSEHVNDRTDPRGWMFNFIQSDLIDAQDVKNIHLGTIRPGEIRGNHCHKNQEEWIFVFGGKGEFVWKEDGKTKSRIVNEAEKILFNIKPSITHSVKNLGIKDIYLCAIASAEYNKDSNDAIKDIIT